MELSEADQHWQPVIAVPARNEAQRLLSLFDALSRQTYLQRLNRNLVVCVVLNNCTDESAAVCAEAKRRHSHLSIEIIAVSTKPSEAHVGWARRLAMDAAIAASDSRLAVVITTDADAQPDCGWIDANLRAIAAGAHCVGGLVIGDATEEALLGPGFLRRAAQQKRYGHLIDRLASLLDPLPYDPWPRHHDHTGASLAVRADVYEQIGGLPPLPFREDLGMVRRLRAAGFRVVHPLDVRVKVSARVHGRAPGGMADCLKRWVDDEAERRPHLVESPELTLLRLRCRNALRVGTVNANAHIETYAADDPDAKGVVPIGFAIGVLEYMIYQTEALLDVA